MFEEFMQLLKNLAHAAGCFEIRSHLFSHSNFSRSLAEKFLLINSLPRHISKLDHFVSAADNDTNKVGIPVVEP